jgi:hypothetical protein
VAAIMNTTVQLKLKRLQSLRSDEAGVLTSLTTLSAFHEPALVPHEDRRTMRGAIEKRSVDINEEFLHAFDGLTHVRPLLRRPSFSTLCIAAACDAIRFARRRDALARAAREAAPAHAFAPA